MRRLWIAVMIIAALLVAGIAVYRYRRSARQLQVAPDAGKEIEKAKRR